MARRPVRIVALLVACLVGALLVGGGPASAHEPGATLVSLSSDGATVLVDARVPIDSLALALVVDGEKDVAASLAEVATAQEGLALQGDLLTRRFEEGVQLRGASGLPWTTRVQGAELVELDGIRNLHVRMQVRPGTGESPERFTLTYRVVTSEVRSHRVYVARPGVEAESAGDSGVLALLLDQSPTVQVDLASTRVAQGARALAVGGFTHFREGPDHLLFLCLVALGALRRQAAARVTTWRLAALSAAFAGGHSLSLAVSTLTGATFSAPWVECAIAATILLAAVHAIRPVLIPRSELVITGAFGLLHGLGFAGTLATLSVSGSGALVPLLAFNLGLEVAQLCALLAVLLPLWSLARSTAASALVASFAALAALSWSAAAVLDTSNLLQPAISAVAVTPERWGLCLIGLALVATGLRRWDDPHLPRQSRA